MKHRRSVWLLAAMLVGAPFRDSIADEPRQSTYEGTWLTTNRKLDGRMTCVVKETGEEKWRGHFYGVWQGVEFSYKVDFSGPPEKLRGKAQIDGADYVWSGAMKPGTPRTFHGSFDGSRYRGRFELSEVTAAR